MDGCWYDAYGIAVDQDDNVYAAGLDKLWKISPTGALSLFTSGQQTRFVLDEPAGMLYGPGTSAPFLEGEQLTPFLSQEQIGSAISLALGRGPLAGSLVLAHFVNTADRLSIVGISPPSITPFAQDVGRTWRLASAPDGTIYLVSLRDSDQPAEVLRFGPDGQRSLFATASVNAFYGNYGGLSVDESGFVYWSDVGVIHRYAPDGAQIETLPAPYGVGAIATAADGRVFVSDHLRCNIIYEYQHAACRSSAPDEIRAGQVWATGDNSYGQLGNGTVGAETSPVRVRGLSDVKAIAASGNHSLAVTEDGNVWAWGDNNQHELGDGTTTQRWQPERIGLTDVATVSAGSFHSLALRNDGTVWGWGDNSCGQLGDGTETSRSTPIRVANLQNIVAISAGWAQSLALDDEGGVWTWGSAQYGQLGTPPLDQCSSNGACLKTPRKIPELFGVTSIHAGYRTGAALEDDGSVWTWGAGDFGSLGLGPKIQTQLTPGLVPLPGVTSLDKGGTDNTIAIDRNGTLWLWGKIAGSATYSPVVVPLSGAVQAYAGGNYRLVVKDDGTIWGWGLNDTGQLGNGTVSPYSTEVLTPERTMEYLSGHVATMSTFGNHTLILTK